VSAGAENDRAARIVVVSDIHATFDGDPFTNVAQSKAMDAKNNALSGAREYLANEIRTADVVICPGDLVHEGVVKPMSWVWAELHGIADDLDSVLIASAGNHDMLLKPTGSKKPHSALRDLDPRFPHDDTGCVATYWAHAFAIVESEQWRVVTVNSSSYLGFFNESEADRGRMDPKCLPELATQLGKADKAPPINICLCHHHPQEWTDDSDEVTNHMLEGDRLIDFLEDRMERWMIIHGHKHRPRLDYLGGSSSGPIRLASGSVGADLLGESGTDVRNQMHVIDFIPPDPMRGLLLAGRIRTVEWEPGVGWVDPGGTAPLPAATGFGYRRDGMDLAGWLFAEAQSLDQRAWTWDQIVAAEPRCEFLTDQDRLEFFDGARRLGGGAQESLREVTFTW